MAQRVLQEQLEPQVPQERLVRLELELPELQVQQEMMVQLD